MIVPIEVLTPREIVAELDKYIVGQNAAKRAVAVALRNRYRRHQLSEEQRDEILPKNILMIGPTGVGKTEIARRLAQLARAPFIKVEATKFTEVGYVGRDVESIIRDLAGIAIRLVEKESLDAVRPEAERRAVDRLVDQLLGERPTRRRRRATAKSAQAVDNPIVRQAFEIFGRQMDDPYPDSDDDLDEDRNQAAARRRRMRKRLLAGELDNDMVEIDVEEQSQPFVQVFTPQGLEEMGLDMNSLSNPFNKTRTTRRVPITEAKRAYTEEEAAKLLDRSAIQREALLRAEQTGIVFLDELDKVAGKSGGSGPDVSREGVQRDLLPIIEGSTVATKFGQVKTDHILFIGAGAFHIAKPSDLIPELQGRLPIRVELEPLTEQDFGRILREPRNALTIQYQLLLQADGVELTFDESALDEIAKIAADVNARTENIGARRLHTIMEKVLEQELFDAPDTETTVVRVSAEMVRERVGKLAEDVDLTRYIL